MLNGDFWPQYDESNSKAVFQIRSLLALKIYHPQGILSDRILQKVSLQTGSSPETHLADAMFWNHPAELLSAKSLANLVTWLCTINRNPGSSSQHHELLPLFGWGIVTVSYTSLCPRQKHWAQRESWTLSREKGQGPQKCLRVNIFLA